MSNKIPASYSELLALKLDMYSKTKSSIRKLSTQLHVWLREESQAYDLTPVGESIRFYEVVDGAIDDTFRDIEKLIIKLYNKTVVEIDRMVVEKERDKDE